jgi:flagellar biosynthesis protein FlhF
MKVKKYTGTVLEKIREVITRELGKDAVIINISENSVKNGILPVGKKKVYEVIAAVEDAADADSLSFAETGKAGEELIKLQKNHYRGIRNSIKRLDEKLAEVDERMEKFSIAAPAGSAPEVAKELRNVHDGWRPVLMEAVREIAKNKDIVEDDWHEALASILPTAGGIMFRRTPSSTPDVYVITGPTGVGKTTTMAKLAAKCVLGEKLNVGLISTDTFRVAAVDQLREYAHLLGTELAVAFSNEELKQQLKNFHEKDVVFIDTPGRGQFDKMGIKSIRETIAEVAGLCVILAVPANIRQEDADAIVENYSDLTPSALIITKTDEASRCDGITKLLDSSKLPVVYLTDGQRVPEDIHAASPGVLASMVMPFVRTKEPVKIGDNLNGKQ